MLEFLKFYETYVRYIVPILAKFTCKSMATACFIADSVNIAKARRLPPPQRIGLIDASIIPIAVTHLPRGIYQKIKNGHIREVEGFWPYRRLCQLNLDARWTKKNNKRFFSDLNSIL